MRILKRGCYSSGIYLLIQLYRCTWRIYELGAMTLRDRWDDIGHKSLSLSISVHPFLPPFLYCISILSYPIRFLYYPIPILTVATDDRRADSAGFVAGGTRHCDLKYSIESCCGKRNGNTCILCTKRNAME